MLEGLPDAVEICPPNLQVREKSRAANATSGRGLRRAVNGPNGTKSFDTSAVLPYRCQHGSREQTRLLRANASTPSYAIAHRPLEYRKRRARRLPSSKHAVSILQLWCTLTFMHVDARLALNQSCGITEGNMAKKAKKAKAKKKTGKKKK